MWNQLRCICLILLFSIQFLCSLDAQKLVDINEWSGTITFTNKTKSADELGGYRIWETRHEATIAKGHGYSQSTLTTQQSNKSMILKNGEEYIVTTTVQANAHGNEIANVGIMLGENTYTIEFTAPGVKGTWTETGPEGPSKTIPWSDLDNGPSISVDEQKLGKNRYVLTGQTTENNTRGTEVDITTITWSFIRGPIDDDLIVTPLAYNTWLPSPGSDEKTPGSQITIGLQLKGKNGKPPKLDAKYFELELKNTSRENGITINYPAKNSHGTAPLPDLGFLPEEGATVATDGQTIKVICDDGKTGSARVAAYDGGGYTILSVEVVLEGGIRVKGHLEKPEGPTDILLPKRKEGSRIATSWLNDNGNPGEDDDKDSSPGNENAGDGLTAYEEYRGVRSEGKFKRLSPKKKELGVSIEKKNMEQFAPGIALLKAAAGIEVIVLNEDELSADRVFNNNSVGKRWQYALKLYNGYAHGVEGVNVPAARHNKTPKLSDSVIIDIDYIRSSYFSQDSAVRRGNKKLPYTAEDDIASTVAHELAHGIHVAHHGPPSDEPSNYESYEGAPVVCKIYDADGNLITDRPYTIKGSVGSVGCDERGDLYCIMAYTSNYRWAYKKGDEGSLIYRGVPFLPQGKRLCTSSKGTGINANGYFGNATEGNCLAQIKVRDE